MGSRHSAESKNGAPLVGANLPWLGGWYGHDLGRNQAFPDWPSCDVDRLAPRLLGMLADLGIRLVRVWLFESGEGLCYGDDQRVSGLDPTFLRNLDVLVAAAAERDVRVYWTLIDANSVRRSSDPVTRSILIDPEKARAFCEIAVRPVLARVREVTWAVDLCNEPEAVVHGQTGNKTGLGFEWWTIRDSLVVLRETVNDVLPGVRTAVGSGFQGQQNVEAGIYRDLDLGTDLVDFHSYGHAPSDALDSEDGELVHAAGLPGEKPVVIGELGVLVPHERSHSPDVWRDAQQALVRRLHQGMSCGYEAIFLWYVSDDYQEDACGLTYRGAPGLALHSLRGLEAGGHVSLTP